MLEKVRVDKWLWAVRIFKSRTLSTDTCKESKVKVNGEIVKASYLVVPGDVLTVKKEGFSMTYKVIGLLEKRVSAPEAIVCYEDLTPEEELNKFNAWYVGGLGKSETRDRGTGRPTKKDRREIDRFKE